MILLLFVANKTSPFLAGVLWPLLSGKRLEKEYDKPLNPLILWDFPLCRNYTIRASVRYNDAGEMVE